MTFGTEAGTDVAEVWATVVGLPGPADVEPGSDEPERDAAAAVDGAAFVGGVVGAAEWWEDPQPATARGVSVAATATMYRITAFFPWV
jgi:hypothetical protein